MHSDKDGMPAAGLEVFDWLIVECLGRDQLWTIAVVQVVAFLVPEGIIVGIKAEGAIECLSPCISLAIVAESKCMRCATGHFLNTADPIDQRRNIAGPHFRVACSQFAFIVAAHGVNVSTITLHKHCVLLTTAHVSDNDVEGAYLGQVVNDLLAANAQLSVVVI